jgi:hypothetical protein
MIETRRGKRFLPEANDVIVVGRKLFPKHLEGDEPAQARVERTVDFTESATAQRLTYLVTT